LGIGMNPISFRGLVIVIAQRQSLSINHFLYTILLSFPRGLRLRRLPWVQLQATINAIKPIPPLIYSDYFTGSYAI